MVEAIVLVQVKVGRSSAVAEAVVEIGGVTEAYVVTGPYDVIVQVEADSLDELGQMVASPHPGGGGRLTDPDLPDPQLLNGRSRPSSHGDRDGRARQSLEVGIGDAHRYAVCPAWNHDPLGRVLGIVCAGWRFTRVAIDETRGGVERPRSRGTSDPQDVREGQAAAEVRPLNHVVVAPIASGNGVALQPKARSNLPLSTTHGRSDW